MQEVKEGGQRKGPGTSRRARCSLCYSCCYKGCLNPQSLAQPHSFQPTCWPAAWCFCVRSVGGQMSGKPKALCLHMLPFLLKRCWPTLTLPPTMSPTPQFPRSDTLAGQKAGVRTGARRTRAQGKAHTEAEAVNSAFSPTKHRWGNVKEGLRC